MTAILEDRSQIDLTVQTESPTEGRTQIYSMLIKLTAETTIQVLAQHSVYKVQSRRAEERDGRVKLFLRTLCS